MFVDTAKVSLKAGKGGDGAVSFRHEIYIPKGGPDGGDGGRGGNIVFRADRNTDTLVDFRFTPILTAENGKNGSGQRSAGRSGKDLIVDVPVGTCVYKLANSPNEGFFATTGAKDRELAHNDGPSDRCPSGAIRQSNTSSTTGPVERMTSTQVISTGDGLGRDPAEHPKGGAAGGKSPAGPVERTMAGPVERKDRILIADLTEDGQMVVIAKGGDGGYGNAHFKSSTRQAPRIAEVGEPGEEFEAELELKTMADVGLVGLPNAGKSTFLSVVSNARPEIADYAFTTITPNLGVATIDGRDLLIADIPGLIEGASEGKGLGHAFLRHVDRTAVLLHLIDVYNDDAGEAYAVIRHELEKYSDLKARPEIVALTKCEGVDEDIIQMQMASILNHNPGAQVYAISSAAHQGITELLRELSAQVVAGPVERMTSTQVTSTGDGLGRDPAEHPKGGAAGGKSPARPVERTMAGPVKDSIPVISLSPKALRDTWKVEKVGDIFVVTGEKIEKFARRTDLNNYASVNRLRDILKKMGIRGELTTLGAQPDSIISIAGKEFPLVEDY